MDRGERSTVTRRRRLDDRCPHCDRRLAPRLPTLGEMFGTALYNVVHVVLLVSLLVAAALGADG